MGNDKFESKTPFKSFDSLFLLILELFSVDEELIRWGWPEDVWFHVDKESSAHVYLRLRPNETLDDIPSSVIDDCAQLVKANSIKGNKLNNLDVIYTLWSNLKKTADMEVGQVGFFDQKAVRTVRVERRVNDVVNRLNKTKVCNFVFSIIVRHTTRLSTTKGGEKQCGLAWGTRGSR